MSGPWGGGVRRMRSQPPPPPPPPTVPRGPLFFPLTTSSLLFYSLNFMRGLCLSSLVLCSEIAPKRFLRRPLMGSCQLKGLDLGSFFFFKVCIVPFLCSPLSLRIVLNISCFLWPKRSIRGTTKALSTG